MPEQVLKKLYTKISPQWKTCFFSALLVGLVAHLYKITNWLPNWDSLVFRYDSQNMLTIGRWFLPVVCSFSSFFDLPLLNGILAILFHALSGVCICNMFRVQKKTTAALIGAVIVSFPTVTSVMMYNYVADGYSIAFLLSSLAALYMTKERPKYWLSVLLIALSTGIYQAYITVTVMLVLLYLIDEMVFHGVTFRNLWKKALWMLVSGILGVALYSIVLKVILAVFSVELLDYQGANAVASLSSFNLPASLYIVKETFRKCFFDISGGINLYAVLNALVFGLTLFGYLRYMIRAKITKKPVELVIIVILAALLIFGAGALALINPEVDYHNLMLMGYCVFYLFFILLYERGTESDETYLAIKRWAVLLTAFLVIANQVVIANVSYHKAQMAYEKSHGVLVRIADRIEQTEGTENCDKLLVVGSLEHSEAYSSVLPPDITGITDGFILRADDEIVGQSVLCSALNDYCHKDYTFVSGEEKKKITQRDEVQTMGVWPAKDCVSVIEDTIVIKLGTEGEF